MESIDKIITTEDYEIIISMDGKIKVYEFSDVYASGKIQITEPNEICRAFYECTKGGW